MNVLVLICTIDEGICRVPAMLLTPAEGVCYVVSWQKSTTDVTAAIERAEAQLLDRADVSLTTLLGRGLSRNRNHAIEVAVSCLSDPLEDAIFVMADDDERFCPDAFERLRTLYQRFPRMDGALLRVRRNPDSQYLKPYPETLTLYGHHPRSYYPSSVEMTFRTRVWQMGFRFDERFGLGSEQLCAGEEEVLLTNLLRRGLRVLIVPEDLCVTNATTTGSRVLDPKILRSKGAVYGYQRSLPEAFLRSLREALSLGWKQRVSPLRLFRELWFGVKYIRS